MGISRYLRVLDYELHVTEWGDRKNPPLIMWHGLARTGRDFDEIAEALSDRYWILCPDTIGRGLSQWADDPDHYSRDFYGKLAVALIDAQRIDTLRWLGLSMGGAIGIHLAGGALTDRITHLVINDIGPELPGPAVERIKGYAGRPPSFKTVSELEAFFRIAYKPYGALTDTQWRRLTETSIRRNPDGTVTPHYDPRMVGQFERFPDDYNQWDAWRRITAKTLLLRGAESDLLLPEVAMQMTLTGPSAKLVTFPGCGHAPALNVSGQIQVVGDFLR
jgi:pimeloyl-ACP methyl ester carboxylesterase